MRVFVLLACIATLLVIFYSILRGSLYPAPQKATRDRMEQTVTYLVAVYPAAEKRFRAMGWSDIANFYDSLWFYYNCEGAYLKGALAGIGEGTVLCWRNSCPNDLPKMPYVPNGKFFSVEKWIASATSGKELPWIRTSSTEKRPEALNPSIVGQTFWGRYTGPNNVWFPARAVTRAVYYAGEPQLRHRKLGNRNCWEPRLPTIKNVYQMPSNWYNGMRFPEVTGASEPGIANSPPLIWLDGNIGSGIFFDTGKTHVTRNKASALYELLQKCPKDYVRRRFGSETAMGAMMNLVTPRSSTDRSSKVSDFRVKSGSTTVSVPLCSLLGSNQTSVPGTSLGWDDVCLSDPAERSTWCDGSLEECILSIVRGSTYPSDRMASLEIWDAPLFCAGLHLGLDSVQCMFSSNGSGLWQYEILVLRGYDAGMSEGDLSALLEVGDAGAPLSSTRVYGEPGSSGPSEKSNVRYREDFVKSYFKTQLPTFLSLRDPFDVEAPSVPCVLSESSNVTCQDNISHFFADEIIAGAPDDQCRATDH